MFLLSLYNTLSRCKEPLAVGSNGSFGMYTCGPTVYRDAHIGNLRSYLMADWIRRILLFDNIDVTHIKNITDVGHMRQEMLEQGEDKVVAAARAEGKSAADIADFYTQRFIDDELSINIIPATKLPKATDHVKEMIDIAVDLVSNGLAYEVDGNVYFAVQKFPSYGELSGNIHESMLQEAVRNEADPRKRDPRDFTLWKAAEEGRDLKWDSPWGEGFPGWHIECSAMSMKYLGKSIDLHTGGVDNIFPHHEGEIAQSEGVVGDPVVKHWVHGQHLLADGVKMAKSAGNAYTVPDLVSRGFDPIAFRYLCMTGRYRSRLNFTFRALASAESALNRLRRHYVTWKRDSAGQSPITEEYRPWISNFIEAVEDDLNLPRGLDILWRLVESDISSSSKYHALNTIDEILGLGIGNTEDMFHVADDIGTLLSSRSECRKEQAYEEADRLREEVLSKGYVVQDLDGELSIVRQKDSGEMRTERWPLISTPSDVPSSIGEASTVEFSVAMVSDGFPSDVKRCTDSLLKFESETTLNKRLEIIILDNGNIERDALELQSIADSYPNVRVLHADHRLGDGAAKNCLFRESQGKYFVLVDPSVESTGAFLGRLRDILSDTDVGIAGFAGLKTTDFLHFHDGEGESGEMDAMQAYCLAFRREDLPVVGLMRETFRFYRNLDIDFSFQFKDKGFKVIADNTLPIVLHEHRGWTALAEQERDDLSRKNYGRFLNKWRDRKDLLVSAGRE